MVSETCSPVERVRGGRDGVTGGSNSKGTTVGVRMGADVIRSWQVGLGDTAHMYRRSRVERRGLDPRPSRGPAVRELSVSDWQK